MTVLIIATDQDIHATAVREEIERLGGSAIVADLSHFPQRASMSVRYTCCGERNYGLQFEDTQLDLDDVGSIWWRRPQHPEINPEIVSETHRLFAANEAHEALAGLWYALDAFWINIPEKDQVAHRKIGQLRHAQDIGLRIPDTLISNNPQDALRFIDSHGYSRVIYKAFSALPEEWRETRVLKPAELELIDCVQYAPVIFQEYVDAVYDVRITVVGDKMFAAAIHSQETEYPVDFRMDMANAKVEAIELPEDVQHKLAAYMKRLGLVYGAIDMRLRPDGEWVFLEINPAGQWLFVEQETGQPISTALAELLVANDSADSPSRALTAGR